MLEKLRQDPKAYPRIAAAAAEKGAELATQVLLYALGWDWETVSAEEGRQAAIAGIGGVEMVLEQGDKGDPEIELVPVDSRATTSTTPNSQKLDFSDTRYEGTTNWVDLEEAQDTWPDSAEELAEKVPTSAPTPYPRDDDKRLKWWDHNEKRVRIVDHWYKRGGRWCYTIYSGDVILEEGESPFKDEKGESICKYLMFCGGLSITTTTATDSVSDWKGAAGRDQPAPQQGAAPAQLPARHHRARRGRRHRADAARARSPRWARDRKQGL